MAKNWTQKLRKAQRESGARVVASVGLYRDESVVYKPRYDYDRHPWILSRMADKDLSKEQERVVRYSGRECQPIFPARNEEKNG